MVCLPVRNSYILCVNIVLTIHVKSNQWGPLFSGNVVSSLSLLNKKWDQILNLLVLLIGLTKKKLSDRLQFSDVE